MSAALHLARPEDLDQVLTLVERFHNEFGLTLGDDARRAGVVPLLQGTPHGALYLIGPARAPVGYIVITFGWSVEFGGMDAFVDELFVRPKVRGRGIATEVLATLPAALAKGGVTAMHLEVDRDNDTARRLYARAGFQARDRYSLMSKRLS
jgi:ribosomal protein S18 acetylase RimI-like enzyme